MRPAQLDQLDAVFQHPQIAVGFVELPSIRAANVAGRAQGRDGGGGIPDPERFIHPRMNELEQLDREFHITQPTAAEFQLPTTLMHRNVLGHTSAHGLHGLDEAVPFR